ncbi:MAG: UDP-N-acetylmuramate dehydrogenase [Candidatus Gastranaerophilales bacterium]|nr:UDP-N-acetylmuramate dehydrogenase [Candidatus Gastranaerophilales bacterium]
MYIEVKENYDIKNMTSFKIGGRVDKLYFPGTESEFIYLLKTLRYPVILGNWSNVLISSAGIRGSVISTSKMNKIEIEDTTIIAQCGVKGPKLAKAALENGLTGFEFMSGFPGSIGGNIYMNASAHSQSISDFLVKVGVFDLEKKETLIIEKRTLDFAYRSSVLQRKPYILLWAEFDLAKKEKIQIKSFIKKILNFRMTYQPTLSSPNAGSVFKNPEDQSAGRLLDKAGVKNFRVGGARIWDKHANFIVNTGNATSSDVLELMFMMYNAVKEKHHIRLCPEIKYFGEKTPREEDICNIIYNQK